nr:MAG TPA: hypothetical protein [Caudoviricetes sp.]
MLGVYFLRKRRKKGHFSRVHFVFLVLSLRLKMRLRFVLRIIFVLWLYQKKMGDTSERSITLLYFYFKNLFDRISYRLSSSGLSIVRITVLTNLFFLSH